MRSSTRRRAGIMALTALASIFLGFASLAAVAGAWGPGAFDNDEAGDWLAALDATQAESTLTRALAEVRAESEVIDVDTCSVAVAAAALIAGASDGKSNGLPTEAVQWLQKSHFRPSPGLITNAAKAVRACADSKRSELSQLWAEGKDNAAWRRTVQTLLDRLLAQTKPRPV